LALVSFRYTSIDDKSITVNGRVHTLISDSDVTRNIYKIYGPPMLDQPQVEDIKTYIEGDELNAVVVTRDEVRLIRDFVAPSQSAADLSETVRETMHSEVFLNPKRGAFGHDPKDWSFYRGEGEVITATIKDRVFLSKYASGEIRLNESDLLTVDLLERQRVRGTKVQRPVYEIIRVTNYQRGPEPQSLPHE
jgi:hypothetical protein